MWSLSYVSLSAAIFFAAFTVLHVSIDLLGWWRATPLRQVGMNSLLIYIGNVMLGVSKTPRVVMGTIALAGDG